MTASTLKKFVIPPVLLSAAIFSALTLPLAWLGSKPVVIELQEEPVFSGKLRDVAAPYLGLVSVLSLGAGVASVAATGWRQSHCKSAQFEEQLSDLQQHLKEKEELLEELRLSKSQVEAIGLNAFLDNEVSESQSVSKDAAIKVAQPVVVATPVHVVEPLVIAAQAASPQPVPRQITAEAAASRFASAQTFLGYAQASRASRKVSAQAATPAAPALPQVEELQIQMKHMVAQMEILQNALQTASQRRTSEGERGALV